jgi:hypothetical protein
MTSKNYVTRDEVYKIEGYAEILDNEKHHDHKIILDEYNVLRWEGNPEVIKMADEVGVNKLIIDLQNSGHTKSSEVYQKLYRDIGYSLCGYWDVFAYCNEEDCYDDEEDEEIYCGGDEDEEIFVPYELLASEEARIKSAS